MSDTNWPFGPVLARARTEHGLATREAARRAGISDTLWRTLERGYETRRGRRFDASPRAETVAKVARAVGLDIHHALKLANIDLSTVDPDDLDGPDLTTASDEQLLAELRRRLSQRSKSDEPTDDPLTRDEIESNPRYTTASGSGRRRRRG